MHAPAVLLCLLLLAGPSATWGDPCRLPVTITAYATGTRTASGLRPRPGMLAVSRDLERAYHLRFGDLLTLANLGTFLFEDRMPPYWTRRIDLYMSSRSKALRFGRRVGVLQMPEWAPSCREQIASTR